MNNKGFTLIELIATLVLIALITVIVAPTVLTAIDTSKDENYKILIKNIKTATIQWYEECKYNYNSNICSSTNEITLKELANRGYLNTVSKDGCTGDDCRIVKDPRNNEDIGSCKIKIQASTYSNDKVTYSFSSLSSGNCPRSYS